MNNLETKSLEAKSATLLTHECGMPILKLMNADGRSLGYVSPFRGYCFQVSATVNGEGDKGSSTVVGLGNIVKAFENFERPATGGGIYSSNAKSPVYGIFSDMAELAISKADIAVYWYTGISKVFEEFIDESIKYITEAVNK
jgi:hypothetical protein